MHLQSGHLVGCLYAEEEALDMLGGKVQYFADLSNAGQSIIDEFLADENFGLHLRQLSEQILTDLKISSSHYTWLPKITSNPQLDAYLLRVIFWDLRVFARFGRILELVGIDKAVTIVPVGWPYSLSWGLILSYLKDQNESEYPQAAIPGVHSWVKQVDIVDNDWWSATRIIRLVLRQYRMKRAKVGGRVRSLRGLISIYRCLPIDSLPRLRTAMRAFVDLWFIVRRIRLGQKNDRIVPLLIRSYASDWGMGTAEIKKLRKAVYLAESNEEITKQDVGVWVENGTPVERQEALSRAGYRVFSQDKLRLATGAGGRSIVVLVASFWRSLTAIMRGERASCWWRYHSSRLLRTSLVWGEVCKQIKPRVFFCYNDLNPEADVRNAILREHGGRIVFYQHSCNTELDTAGEWAANSVYSFQIFDIVATWGKGHQRSFPSFDNRRKVEFWDVGCIWSELARSSAEDPVVRAEFSQQMLRSSPNIFDESFTARIAVFDTSVSPKHTPTDLLDYYAGICRLAALLPQVLFVCKPKGPLEDLFEAAGDYGKEMRVSLENATNVVILHDYFETATIIGIADLSISMCYTSTLVESIGCGKRAVYYDPSNAQPLAFWTRIPGMVCISDDELHKRVQYLLWECDDETYLNYLHTHCKDIEGFFDGRAITRLRRHIRELIAPSSEELRGKAE